MMKDVDSNPSKDCFNEFAIANFGQFQIAIPSGTQRVPRQLFSINISLPKRYYSTDGILIWNQHLAFCLSGLKLKNLFPESSPFSSLKRLATGIPLSFEIQSCTALPQALIQLATLTCQVQSEEIAHYAVFRDIMPQFVQIVPNQGVLQLAQQAQRCLQQESAFIQANWPTLKKTDFYRQTFLNL